MKITSKKTKLVLVPETDHDYFILGRFSLRVPGTLHTRLSPPPFEIREFVIEKEILILYLNELLGKVPE